jgi:hypothetical protein
VPRTSAVSNSHGARSLDELTHWGGIPFLVCLQGVPERALQLKPDRVLAARLRKLEESEKEALDHSAFREYGVVARPTAKGGAETPNDFVPVSAETAERRQAFKEILPPSHKQSGEPSFQSQTKAKAANERHVEASAAAHVNAPRPGTPRKPRTARALRITARSEHATRIRRTRLPSSFRDAPHVLALLAAEVDTDPRSGQASSVRGSARWTQLARTFGWLERLLGAHDGIARSIRQLNCLCNSVQQMSMAGVPRPRRD